MLQTSSTVKTNKNFLVLFSVFIRWKVNINENVSFTDYASGIRLPDCPKLAINCKNDSDVTNSQHDVIVSFFNVVLFCLSSLVSGSSFMSMSSLFLELWQFSVISDWPEIWKLEIPMTEFFPIDWWELETLNVAPMSPDKMLLNAAKWQSYGFQWWRL